VAGRLLQHCIIWYDNTHITYIWTWKLPTRQDPCDSC